MLEGVHLAGECSVVEQGHGIFVRPTGRELKVVNACGGAGVYLHEEEGEFQIVDGNEQPIDSFAVSVGKEIAEESGLDQVMITAPSFAVLGEADLKGLCLSA